MLNETGVKRDASCILCGTAIIGNAKKLLDICTNCSDELNRCRSLDEILKNKEETEMEFKTKLRSAIDASRATEQTNARLHKSRMERIIESINSSIEEGKYAITIDDLDEDGMKKLQEMGYIVVYNHFGKFDYTISW